MAARWWHSAAFVAAGLVVAGASLSLFLTEPAVLALVVALACAWLVSPMRRHRTSSHWEAQQRHVRDGAVIIYWRPGCWPCLRMRLWLLGRARRASWVDVWADPAASAFVRDVNGGAEIVPTVILPDGSPMTNPRPELVRAAVAA